MPVGPPLDPTTVQPAPAPPTGPAPPIGGVPAVPMPPPWTAPVGYPVGPYPAVPVVAPPKSKAAAALLCFFLGSFGVHRFYTGQTGLGLAFLLTTLIVAPLTCGLSLVGTGIWVLVDFVLILTGGVTDEYGRPLA